MRHNLMILGLILVLGGCDGVETGLPMPDGGASINTAINTSVDATTRTATYTYYRPSSSVITTATGTYTVIAPGGAFTWAERTVATATHTAMGNGIITVTDVTYATVTNTATLAETYARPVSGMKNPCYRVPQTTLCVGQTVFSGGFTDCGWNGINNKCYGTEWCEPSVPMTNGSSLRPASAKCVSGQQTFTYNPGELLMWGNDMMGTWNYSGANGSPDGHICIPNTQVVTINC
jgi:hypothetical protein